MPQSTANLPIDYARPDGLVPRCPRLRSIRLVIVRTGDLNTSVSPGQLGIRCDGAGRVAGAILCLAASSGRSTSPANIALSPSRARCALARIRGLRS
jgi:hypothetical protein